MGASEPHVVRQDVVNGLRGYGGEVRGMRRDDGGTYVMVLAFPTVRHAASWEQIVCEPYGEEDHGRWYMPAVITGSRIVSPVATFTEPVQVEATINPTWVTFMAAQHEEEAKA